jgi:hypothetical protein
MVDLQGAKTAINELAVIDRRLHNNLIKTRKAIDSWDFKVLEKVLEALGEDARLLLARHEDGMPNVARALQGAQEFVAGEEYPGELERSLRDAHIPLQGSYPNYELIPFKLILDPGQGAVILSVGRKSERISAFEPQQVAAWVAARYKKLVDKKFDSQRFCRELVDAYQTGNRIAYKQDEVLWGHAVSLSTIYELLTVRYSARQEYPKELYIFELGRLKEQLEIRYQNYRLVFGTAKKQKNALLVTDSQGRENSLSSLIIFHEEGHA